MEDKKEGEVPKWANFVCPSCAITYGISAIIRMIKKRKMTQSITEV